MVSPSSHTPHVLGLICTSLLLPPICHDHDLFNVHGEKYLSPCLALLGVASVMVPVADCGACLWEDHPVWEKCRCQARRLTSPESRQPNRN